MIGKLSGFVEHLLPQGLILMTSGGVGYVVFTSSRLGAEIGQPLSLFIHTVVREDALDLYGFSDLAEKDLFLLLTSVQGVGNRVGITILSSYDAGQIYQALATQDTELFRSISGIGPKLAERIVVELKNKVGGIVLNPVSSSSSLFKKSSCESEAISALMNLGYKRGEVASLVQKILVQQPDVTLEQMIPLALRELSSFS